MAKLRKIAKSLPETPDYTFYCPGCKTYHAVWVNSLQPPGRNWSFNGDVDRPSFSPSILVRYPAFREFDSSGYIGVPGTEYMAICHSYIKEGKIQFLDDCTHKLAGQTIEMQEEDE